MHSSREQTKITDIRTVGVPVSDQSRSLHFYVGQLGFEKRLDVPFGGGRWLEVAPHGAITSTSRPRGRTRRSGARGLGLSTLSCGAGRLAGLA